MIGPVIVLSALGASLLALVASARVHRRERRRARRAAVREVQSRIGGHDFRTGVWLVGIPRARARQAQERGAAAANGSGPERVLDVWEAEGGALLGHVAGPSFSAEDAAGAWVERTSDELSAAPVAWPDTPREHSVLAVVLASGGGLAASASRAASLRDLRERLGADCVGVAFVACPEGAAGQRAISGSAGAERVSSPGTLRALSAARWALGALVALLAGYAGVALASDAEGWARSGDPGPRAGQCVDATARSTAGVAGEAHTAAQKPSELVPSRSSDTGTGGAGLTGSPSADTGMSGAGRTSSPSADTGTTSAGTTTSSPADTGTTGAGPSTSSPADTGTTSAGRTASPADTGTTSAGRTGKR